MFGEDHKAELSALIALSLHSAVLGLVSETALSQKRAQFSGSHIRIFVLADGLPAAAAPPHY